jgi:hypothetical protein
MTVARQFSAAIIFPTQVRRKNSPKIFVSGGRDDKWVKTGSSKKTSNKLLYFKLGLMIRVTFGAYIDCKIFLTILSKK